jgi:N12 class adenine-specific DNA methylase
LYHPYTGEWQVKGKGRSQFSDVNATVTYGTGRMNAYQILEDTLNLRDVRVYDIKEDADGKERRVLNKKETMLAQQKQEMIKQRFKDWIWNDPERRQTLVTLYNEQFNSIRNREYDGSHITFGGISQELELRPHQLNAIAHILYGGNTLLAHEVGAGKTFEMVAAAMEAKRLGQCHKSLFAVPNHLTEQWAAEFLRFYPSANILVATKKDFEMRNRKKFCAKIATGDYDAVIIGHSQLEKIPMSKERQERLLSEQILEIEDGVRELKAENGEKFSIKQLEKTKRGLEVRLSKLLDAKKRDDTVTFEQLGCDRLYIDEAHNFKNLFLYTKMRNVAGLSTSEAQKSSDLFMKCRYLDEITGNKGVIFATGTPISNSITEMFTMQRYLQYDRLSALGLLHFDSWASIFGETQTSIELAPEGTGYRARTRFAKFHNLPELMSIFKDAADIQTADMLNLPVPEARFENIIVEPSDLQKELVEDLSERAAKVNNREVDPRDDNMLKIVRCKTQKCILSAGERY